MDTPEERVLAVELVRAVKRDEPLRVVRMPLAVVGHAHEAATGCKLALVATPTG